MSPESDDKQRIQRNFAALRSEIDEAERMALNLISILEADKNKTGVADLDITSLIDDSVLPNVQGRVKHIERTLEGLSNRAYREILRFRVFENPEEDPSNWPGAIDADGEGLGPEPFNFVNECLHLLGRGYFSPAQEELIWEQLMVSADYSPWSSIYELNNLLKDDDYGVGPNGCYHYYSPSLHPDYRTKIPPRIRELAERMDFHIGEIDDKDVGGPACIADEAKIVIQINDGEIFRSLLPEKQDEIWRAVIRWNSHMKTLGILAKAKEVALMSDAIKQEASRAIQDEILELAISTIFAPASVPYPELSFRAKKQRHLREHLGYNHGEDMHELAELYPELKEHRAYQAFVQ
jgi:hypothetical protein